MENLEKCVVTYQHNAERTTDGIFIGGIPLRVVINNVNKEWEPEITHMLECGKGRMSIHTLLAAYLEGSKTVNSRTLKEEMAFLFMLSCTFFHSQTDLELPKAIHRTVKGASEKGLNITQTIETMVGEYLEMEWEGNTEILPVPVITLVVSGFVTTLIAKMKTDPIFFLTMMFDV